jgi:hypothetical protein
METYLIELRVDKQWLEAIDKLTGDIYEGEVCEWIRLQPEYVDDEDLTNDNENEIIK